MRLDPKGERFIAASDKGTWFTGRIVYRDREMTGLADVEAAPMLAADGRTLAAHNWFDTESMALDGGTIYVGIERVNRIVRFDFGRDGVRARGEDIAVPPAVRKLPYNRGLEAMRENLHRFFRAARGAGVRVSPAESIDAMRAVADVGFADRTLLRDTFLLTLAKTQDEKKALGECFDLFFKQPELAEAAPASDSDAEQAPASGESAPGAPAAGAPSPSPDLGPLAQMLLSQDRAEIANAMAQASSAASLSEIRYFTQRGIFSARMFTALRVESTMSVNSTVARTRSSSAGGSSR